MDDIIAYLVESLRRLIVTSPDDSLLAQDSELQEEIERLFVDLGHGMPLLRNLGRGATKEVIRFQDEAEWLLAASRDQGPYEAARRLRAFVAANESSYSEILLFWGMHPPDLIEVADGIELGPLDALPPCDPQAYFLASSMSDEDRRSTDYVTQFPKPRAVLVKHTPAKPIYFGPGDLRQEFTYEDKFFLTELMQLLPVVTRSPVIRIAEWHTWPSDAPVVSRDGGYGWTQHARATHELPKTPFDESSVAMIVGGFLALDPLDRNRLRLPLRRLNAFFLSESLGDRAIEAGVALESLLSEPGDPKDGITHRLAVRAALLTEIDLDARKSVTKRVRDLYTLRSIAGHGSDLDEVNRERAPWGVEGRFKRPEEIRRVLDDAPELISTVLTAIVRLGEFPDYASLDLSPDGLAGGPAQLQDPGDEP